MKSFKIVLLAIGLMSFFSSANASLVNWTLNNVTLNTLSNGNIVSAYLYGSFSYDADTNTYDNFVFSIGDSNFKSDAISTTLIASNANGIEFIFDDGFPSHASLYFASALNNQGGIVNVIDGDFAYFFRVKEGTITGLPAAGIVPEPESYSMMLAGLGLMGFVATRRKNV